MNKKRIFLFLLTVALSPALALAASTPTASPVPDTYSSPQIITITSSGADTIRYTTSSTNPSCDTNIGFHSGNPLTIPISNNTTVKAQGCSATTGNSSVASFTYNFQCSPSSVSNGTVGPYPMCDIICDSGYERYQQSCVQSGGSSSGGSSSGGSSSGGSSSGGSSSGGGGGGGFGFNLACFRAPPAICVILFNIVGTALYIASGIVIIGWLVTGYFFLSAQGDPGKLGTGRKALFASVAGTFFVIIATVALTLVRNASGL